MDIIELEFDAIAGIFMDDKSAKKIVRKLKPEHFKKGTTREAFQIARDVFMHHQVADINIFKREAKARKVEWDPENMHKILLPEGFPRYSVTQLDFLISEIKNAFKKRMLVPVLKRSIEMLDGDPVAAIMSYMTKEMVRIKTAHTETRIRTIPPNVVEHIRSRSKEMLIPTGFNSFDKKFFGFRKGQYVVIAGRPSSGKTALCLCMIMNLIEKQKLGCAYISLETDADTIMYRMLSSKAQVPLEHIIKDELSDDECARLDKCAARIAGQDFFVSDTYRMTVEQITDHVRQLKHYSKNLSIVVIDHIGLIKPEKDGNRNEQLGGISRNLKILGRELGVVVIPLVQLSRAIETTNRTIPKMADLRECGDIEQDADIILAFHNKSKDEPCKYIQVLKAKEGEANVSIKFGWDKYRQTFS